MLYFGAVVALGVCVLCVVVDLLVMKVEQRLSEAFRKLLAAISEAKNLQKPLKNQGFLKVFGKRRFRSLESFRSLLELGFGRFLGLLWPLWGPFVALFGVLWALRRLLLGSAWGRFRCLLVQGWRLGCVSCVMSSIFRVMEAK